MSPTQGTNIIGLKGGLGIGYFMNSSGDSAVKGEN